LYVFYPFLAGLPKAFYNYDGGTIDTFVGFQNFRNLWSDPYLVDAFRNALIIMAFSTFAAITMSLFVAWLIHHVPSARLRYIFRNLVMAPSVVPTVVLLLVWTELLAPNGGVNQVLSAIGLGSIQPAWLGEPGWVLAGILLASFPWINGIFTLMYCAALDNIPAEMYEAAKIDGAGIWATFWHIEAPAVRSQTKMLLLLSVLTGLQSYESVMVMTKGGPFDSSDVPGLLVWKDAFSYSEFGYATAMAVLILAATAALYTLIAVTLRKARDGSS
jgi:ABC-type sugar transport system permease subunit